MIIASKGHIRIKGTTPEVMAEFVTIADSLMDDVGISPEMLRTAVDVAILNNKKEKHDDHPSN